MSSTEKSSSPDNKPEEINLLLSNDRNRELLQNLLSEKFVVVSRKNMNFSRYNLILIDAEYLARYKEQIANLKQDSNTFTPIILLQEQAEKAQENFSNLFDFVEDVIDLPVSKKLLLARVENLIHNKRLWTRHKIIKDRYENIFNNINDMVFLVDFVETQDTDGPLFKISEANAKLREKLNYQEASLENVFLEEFMSEKDIEELAKVREKREEKLFTAEFLSGQQKSFPVEINARRVKIHKNEQILCAARDITEQKKKEERINYLLFHDELTDLYNRRFFEEEIKRLNAERQLPLTIFIIDINGMKLVNDSYGHEVGDELLIKTADLLQKTFREEDILARWGGDEFSVLLPQTTASEAENILARIKSRCEETEEDRLPVSLGIGYAVKENLEQDILKILNKADGEMYRDKLMSEKSAANNIVNNMLSTLATKSPETKAHTNRMAAMAMKLGNKIGLSNNQLNNLSLLATLHDIGKINISESILIKPEDLTEDEWERIKDHPHIGYKIALSCDDFSSVADEILSHHERWDGEGYPQGLAEDEIPLLSRIITIIDAYDVMTNGRPYKEAMTKTEAIKELEDCAGGQFDPELVEEFVIMIERS